MKAVILAGAGVGRLRPYASFFPKPMLLIGKKPLLMYLINWIKHNKITNIVLCVSNLKDPIIDYFGDGSKFGVEIEYAVANRPLSRGGQLKTAEPFINDTFVCVYGDSVFIFNLRQMINQHKEKKSFITMSVQQRKTAIEYGVIETTNSDKVVGLKEKPEITNINVGCYVMEPGIFKLIPPNGRIEMMDVFKKALAERKEINSFIIKNGIDLIDSQIENMSTEYIIKYAIEDPPLLKKNVDNRNKLNQYLSDKLQSEK